MGKASRWFRGLFTAKKPTSYPAPADHPNPPQEETRNKKWGFVKSFREKDKPVPALDREMDENKRAIAVAAATAAVAEAAVAAAQAAAVVVRLTSSGRVFGRKREDAAAVRIQAAFRAYLARRALRALKSLVKLQALVRGNIVRKQATETLRCMQALVRVQARARACRSLRSYRNGSNLGSHHHPHPPSPEKLEQHKRSNACKPERSSILKSNGNSELRWLGQWMADRYWDDENAKILEIDTGKSNKYTHSSSNPFGRSFTTVPDSPSKDSTIPQYSISSPSSVNMEVESLSPLRFPIVDGCEYADSPQFFSASSTRRGRLTPAKSECSMSMFSGYSDCPSYMANTESSWVKFRSQSAPKQRPEFNKSVSTKRMPGSVRKTFAAYSVHRQGLSRFREVR